MITRLVQLLDAKCIENRLGYEIEEWPFSPVGEKRYEIKLFCVLGRSKRSKSFITGTHGTDLDRVVEMWVGQFLNEIGVGVPKGSYLSADEKKAYQDVLNVIKNNKSTGKWDIVFYILKKLDSDNI